MNHRPPETATEDNVVLLIVEDHPLLQIVIAQCLRKGFPGCRLFTCSTAEEALQTARTQRVDAVLMDIGLPGINGIEATRQIKSFAPHVPVVMLTGHRKEHYGNLAQAAGASGYVFKEAMYEELTPLLKNLLMPMDATCTARTSAAIRQGETADPSDMTERKGKKSRHLSLV